MKKFRYIFFRIECQKQHELLVDLPDNLFTASTTLRDENSTSKFARAHFSRINPNDTENDFGVWIPDPSDENPWIIANFGRQVNRL